MSKKRNRIEILAEILEFCRQPQLRTHIMYQANLSWRPVTDYLHFCREMGVIVKVGKRYKVTERGRQLLKELREVLKWTM